MDGVSKKYLKPDEVEKIGEYHSPLTIMLSFHFSIVLLLCYQLGEKLTVKGSGHPVLEEWTKMSKSKYNGLDPDVSFQRFSMLNIFNIEKLYFQDVIREYGIDSTRLFMLGNISPRSHRKWDPQRENYFNFTSSFETGDELVMTVFSGLLNWEYALWSAVAEYLKRSAVDWPAETLSPSDVKKHDQMLFDGRNFYLKGVRDYSFSLIPFL